MFFYWVGMVLCNTTLHTHKHTHKHTLITGSSGQAEWHESHQQSCVYTYSKPVLFFPVMWYQNFFFLNVDNPNFWAASQS